MAVQTIAEQVALFSEMEVGDTFEFGELLPGLVPDEPILWDLYEKFEDSDHPGWVRYTLGQKFLGVGIGFRIVWVNKEKGLVKWRTKL